MVAGVNHAAMPKRIGFLGGYVPRRCGIATFTHDLCEAVAAAAPAAQCFVVAVNDRADGYAYPPRVLFELSENDLNAYRRAADFLNFNNADVLCVQHEFGIYGGPAGSHVLALLREVRMPVVTVLHTVLKDPGAAQRQVTDELVRLSDRVVVMARKGAELLKQNCALSDAKVDVIPHGIPEVPLVGTTSFKEQFGVEGRTVLLTFGLLGPGKGIEYAIEALPAIVRRHPEVVYLVLGATHPHQIAREGESYRLSLERLAEDRGVKEHVIFYNRFVSPDDLKEFIGATDIYLTPYLNEAQITSGTLSFVFGAGKAIVSTPYWHAQELLSGGRGVLVPFRDAGAIADAVCELIEDPPRFRQIGAQAYQSSRDMVWPVVAQRYLKTFQQACAERRAAPRTAFAGWTLASRPVELPAPRLDHIQRMTDGTGIFQHAIFNVPNLQEGYCTDDNARALILCTLLDGLGGGIPGDRLHGLATIYLAFLAAAFDERSGRFRNFMSHDRVWLERTGSEDSHGRALWALGTCVARSRNDGHRRLSAQLFDRGLRTMEGFSSPRAWAFALLGIHEYLRQLPEAPAANAMRHVLTQKVLKLWSDHASDDWPWFEGRVTYDNARLCQALILGGRCIPHPGALDIGLRSLRWLASVQRAPSGHFRPIGSNGFYARDGVRAEFDQQPVEAHAMVSASIEAFRATLDASWSREARRAFEWFLGRNDLGLPLYDSGSGGCRDGLHPDRANENEGAESSLAFHLALAEMTYAGHMIADPIHCPA